MEAWESYQMYLGLKLHFTTDYDYTRYGGRTSASKASFLKRKDRNFFARVARKYGESTQDYYISNFLHSPKGYIGDFREENYTDWCKRKQALTYNFITDMRFLFEQISHFDDIFSLQKGQHPVILRNYLAKRINLETLVILQGLVGFVKQLDKGLKDDLVWPETRRMVVKYGAFLKYDKEKCRVQLLKLIKETF